jgi:6-phosphogluconolactonase
MIKPEIRFYQTADEVAQAAAGAWSEQISTIPDLTRYCCALSGGRIANPFYAALAGLPNKERERFREIHYFWADERCVPPNDAESNYRTAAQLLFAPLNVPENHIHRIRGEENPIQAALSTSADLKSTAAPGKQGLPILDIAILGLGEDGHTASLFPGEGGAALENPAIYRAVIGPKPPPNRVTLGYRVLAAARTVFMLASGGGKEGALRQSLEPHGRTPFARLLEMRRQKLGSKEIDGLATIFTDISGL